MAIFAFNCEFCGKRKEKYKSPRGKTPRFCDKSCSNAWQHANGKRRCTVNDRTIKEWWLIKFGPEGAEQKEKQWKEKMSLVTSGESNPMYGRKRSPEEMEPALSAVRGKTLEEICGKERAASLRKERSEQSRGSNNPAYGKVYFDGGKSVKGYYKGKFFRSLMEYSFLKHLEENDIDICLDVKYENFVIPYNSGSVERTYTPDFFIPKWNVVFEIKPAYAISLQSNLMKFAAAREYFSERCIDYRVMTEHEFRKIPFVEAKNDPNIKFKENTFDYFNKK